MSWLVVATLFVVTLWVACSKKDSNPESSKSDKHKLSLNEIKYLEKKYKGLKISTNAMDNLESMPFNSLSEVEDTIHQLEAYLDELFSIPDGEMAVTFEPNLLTPTSPSVGCAYGSYITYPVAAGLMSSFRISFQYGPDGISNVSFSVSGIKIGWSWEDHGTHKYELTTACSQGTALFAGGILGWQRDIHINWSFNPSTCRVTANAGYGACGTVVPGDGDVEPGGPGSGGPGGPGGGTTWGNLSSIIPNEFFNPNKVKFNNDKPLIVAFLTGGPNPIISSTLIAEEMVDFAYEDLGDPGSVSVANVEAYYLSLTPGP